jgi:hypothetical protein
VLLADPSGLSDQSADDLVEGLGLAGVVVEPGAGTDQRTAVTALPRKRLAEDRRATCAQR